jgi:hypothetical protein
MDDEISSILADMDKIAGRPTHLVMQPEVARAVTEWLDWWESLPQWRKMLYRAWWAIKDAWLDARPWRSLGV